MASEFLPQQPDPPVQTVQAGLPAQPAAPHAPQSSTQAPRVPHEPQSPHGPQPLQTSPSPSRQPAQSNQQLIELLNYIEQVEKLKKRATYVVPTDFFAATEAEMKGLPGLAFDLPLESDGDEIWLRVPRVKEIAPPELDLELEPWVILSRSTDAPPQLRAAPAADTASAAREGGEPESGTAPQALFDWYLEELWLPWARAERPRRRTAALYNKLFAIQQSMATDGAETALEFVWGIGHTSWKKSGNGPAVRHPLITQLCDLRLDEQTLALEVRPRDAEPRLEVDCYAELEVAGVPHLENFWRAELDAMESSATGRITPFDVASFDRVVTAAVGYLDASGKYVSPPDRQLPPASDTLAATDTWVIFARKRSEHIFLQDIERLKVRLDDDLTLPEVLAGFVERGSEEVQLPELVRFRGLSSSQGGDGVRELYFPLPYNDEQVAIAQRLETGNGVVVQGPPGTGKTHTIANIICHYLAQGKRVLVTSKGESALAVVQEKLPESIRPLCVSLLSDEREGMKQFEHAIQQIATRVGEIQPARLAAEIRQSEVDVDVLHQKLASTDARLSGFAQRHMRFYPYRNGSASPAEMALAIVEREADFGWLTDPLNRPVADAPTEGGAGATTVRGSAADAAVATHEPGFGDADVAALRQARILLQADLACLGQGLPQPADFPDQRAMRELHADLLRLSELKATLAAGSIRPLVDGDDATLEQARALLAHLNRYLQARQEILVIDAPWKARLSAAWEQKPPSAFLETLAALIDETAALEAARVSLASTPVSLAQGAQFHEDFQEALARLVEDKSAFFLPFGKQEARKIVDAVTVTGVKPTSAAEWRHVALVCRQRIAVTKLLARWNAICGEFDLPAMPPEPDAALRQLTVLHTAIRRLETFAVELVLPMRERIARVFGAAAPARGTATGPAPDDGTLGELIASLEHALEIEALSRTDDALATIHFELAGFSHPVADDIRDFLVRDLGRPDVPGAVVTQRWETLLGELRRLAALRAPLATVERVARLLEDAGAPQWAQQVREEPAVGQVDRLAPLDWRHAWNWRCAKTFLQSIDVHDDLKTLHARRQRTETELGKAYRKLIANRTWLGVYDNSPPQTRQALQHYLNAVQALGAGTGIRAARHRKTAREAMQRAYKAVPCWVMPQWRVSESIPAEIGLFDLVVVDEASQSDIWALPALLRGKKLLIVGDHKQVSPSAVGMAEQKIVDLQNRFLKAQPYGSEMTPDKSIYDLARVVFAGSSIMLKEHFRCVPAIIEFSNREFYRGEIRPLRIPKRSERLDPPLVDVFVGGGYRKGDTNPPEAEAIVAEIEAILEDSRYAGRSIGVVTLLGIEQAQLIHGMIHRRIGTGDILARQIAVGAPPVFQGRERDIMLLSLVAAKGDRATSSQAGFEQRFNVAASRARDRMILFRSIGEPGGETGQPGQGKDGDAGKSGAGKNGGEHGTDLKARLLAHFQQPFRQDPRRVTAQRELCESGFEEAMFDALTQRGYRISPQVKVGGYRLDFVVEGAQDRRLVIECDGDRFHGPAQWLDDMTRQRVLERAGWTFWRCFASSFVLRREAVLNDLFLTLSGMGIEPIGSEAVDGAVWVEHRVIEPFADEALAEPAAGFAANGPVEEGAA